MAALGLSKVFILDKYFAELQKFWETEKKLQDASSSNEAVDLQRRLISLSSELVTLRSHLHEGPAPPELPPALPPSLPPAPPPSLPPAPPPAPDLIHLPGPLTEDALLRALQARFSARQYCTHVGPVLLAVNSYSHPRALTPADARVQDHPELARAAQRALRQQADTGAPQALVVAGCAGSGKTHASMVLLRRLFDVAGGGPGTDAFKRLAAAFTVLRALGTAATRDHSHASRIGHFVEVQLCDAALCRTKIHCYFLDHSRVAGAPPAPGERNYHVFYQMLAGLSPDERARLQLCSREPSDLRYLCAGRPPRRPDPDDAARFRAWKTCLGVLGIPYLDVVRVLAAVLLLGEIRFEEEAGAAAGDPAAGAAASLLGVAPSALVRGLTVRSAARGQAAARATPAAAVRARDSLAKALYCRTVATIVRRANSLRRPGSALGTLSSDSGESAGAGAGRAALSDAVQRATDGFVGVLDVFGFEDGRPARLEQLCANLSAETMQHFYNTHVFKSAAESCREEGVAAPEPEYADCVPCIDLVSSLRGGLLALLDAECAAGGTADGYVARALRAHRRGGRLREARPPHPRRFVVRHFAGDVLYDATEFPETNRDAVPDDAVAAFDRRGCDFGFATHLFGTELKALAAGGGPRGGRFRAAPGGAGSTLTQDFHTRLDNLLRTLVHARPHFVRCVRSNAREAPQLWERTVVASQLRALQTLETATLMAAGYPHRLRFRAFLSRYGPLAPEAGPAADDPERCGRVLRAAESGATTPPASPAAVRWALGKRHVFLSEAMRQVLERSRRSRRESAARCVQAAWRRHRAERTGGGARPRPAPIAGTPPPSPGAGLARRACTLIGLDAEVPPPLPPARAYTVAGGVKLGYPQWRRVAAEWSTPAGRLRPGQAVLVLGAARPGHLLVRAPAPAPGAPALQVPHAVLLPPAARVAPPTHPALTPQPAGK